jgi:hypothetical protein
LGSEANTVVLSGSSSAPTVVTGDNDYYYQFRNGVLVGAVSLVVVPNVVNDSLSVATSAIKAAGLTVGTTTQQMSTSVPTGSVISQTPAGGASVAAGSAVNLVVSSGRLRGDVNGDGQVDVRDFVLILEAFDKRAGPNDPRDLNHDGIINLRDAFILTTLCTHPACAIHARSH